jgi:hypothetical protein
LVAGRIVSLKSLSKAFHPSIRKNETLPVHPECQYNVSDAIPQRG